MRWTVYCRVIDNFGDLGVCWRLAADLASRGEAVQLVVDDAGALAWMAPTGHAGVGVSAWGDLPAIVAAGHSDVVVETFGCGLPEGTREAWSRGQEPPVHINVEHLSAETFVERSHGLPSPPVHGNEELKPSWYFYPGFTARTGGLLREQGLDTRRLEFLADGHDASERADSELRIYAFCYESAAFAALLDAWPDVPTALVCAPGDALHQAQAWVTQHGRDRGVRLIEAGFVAQERFDALLWPSDLNIVRGEDSIVRALWAARPFVWHLYPQGDGAHAAKLEAFLDLFLAEAGTELAGPLRHLFRCWNGLATPPLRLPDLLAWRAHCERFAAGLRAQADLGSQLIRFARTKR